jgi:hypothetical protein
MARKGSNVLSKPLFGVVALALVIFAMVFLYVKLSSISNPCWQGVLTGLEPLKLGTAKSPVLNFDGECLDRFVITASSGVCGLECRKIDDEEQQRACAAVCSSGDSTNPKTFIIALPNNKGLFEKVAGAIHERSLYWLMNGKAEVFTVNCQVSSIDASIKECPAGTGGISTWECTPKDAASSYTLAIDATKKICDIKVKV